MLKKDQFSVDIEQAVEEYADMVYRLALVNMKDKTDADDIFQEVFLRLLKYKKTIESNEHLKAWLLRVTINCCKSKFSSAWEKRIVSLEYETLKEEAYEMQEEHEDVLQAVRELPEIYKNLMHLFYYEQYSIKEIMQIVQKSESAVKTGLSRGRDMLRKALEGDKE